ncbi:MAG: hypothetical protein ACJAUP_002885 [Cellvibrionaceae bacterium]|jgi:hypothetical protein
MEAESQGGISSATVSLGDMTEAITKQPLAAISRSQLLTLVILMASQLNFFIHQSLRP